MGQGMMLIVAYVNIFREYSVIVVLDLYRTYSTMKWISMV